MFNNSEPFCLYDTYFVYSCAREVILIERLQQKRPSSNIYIFMN